MRAGMRAHARASPPRLVNGDAAMRGDTRAAAKDRQTKGTATHGQKGGRAEARDELRREATRYTQKARVPRTGALGWSTRNSASARDV